MTQTTKKNIYFCFIYSKYHPCGGMDDCELITDDFSEAREWLLKQDTEYENDDDWIKKAYIYDVRRDDKIYLEI